MWLMASVPLWLAACWLPRADALAAPASFLVVGAVAMPVRRGHLLGCLDWRPLAILGTASYSLYLWHVPIGVAIWGSGWAPRGFISLLVVVLPICILAALASYAVIETPFLRLRRSWAGRSRIARAPAVLPAVRTA
jgi:peptidoglycan/LPS O-acetylase OafA/YrhL